MNTIFRDEREPKNLNTQKQWYIKRIAYLLLLVSVKFNLYASPDSIPVGTIIYSVIKPEKFLPKNPTWMLLDGCDSLLSKKNYGDESFALEKFQRSKLHIDLDSLPDARGLFIRGMNEGRNDKMGDAEGDRKTGKFQKDLVGPHHHKLSSSILILNSHGVKLGADAAYIGNGPQPTELNEGNETRPRNLAFYIYIKVN